MRRLQQHFVITLAILTVLIVPAGIWVWLAPGPVRSLIVQHFGPSPVTMNQAYAEQVTGTTFDHGDWGTLLRKHVDDHGWIDYAGFEKDAAAVDAYISALGQADFDALNRDEKLALLINAYNAFTVRLILDYRDGGELASIFDIPEAKRWDHQRWSVMGRTVSLNQLEHEIIRKDFKEPRIHWVLVCAAVGCPPLRNEAYTGAKLEAQLAAASEYVHNGERWFRFDASSGKLQLTSLYEWYAGDFEQAAGSVLEYVAQQSPAVAVARDAGQDIRISYLDYSWKLNDIRNRP